MKRRTNVERCRSVFILPCYPSEVLKGRERGDPFVPQEPADGCNPFQNAHWKSIKVGWTWLYEGRGGRHVSQGGGLSKDAESNERLWRGFPPKNGIVRNNKRNELR